MLRFIRIRFAERRYWTAVGECIAYNRVPLHIWDVNIATALRLRRDSLAGKLALLIQEA